MCLLCAIIFFELFQRFKQIYLVVIIMFRRDNLPGVDSAFPIVRVNLWRSRSAVVVVNSNTTGNLSSMKNCTRYPMLIYAPCDLIRGTL